MTLPFFATEEKELILSFIKQPSVTWDTWDWGGATALVKWHTHSTGSCCLNFTVVESCGSEICHAVVPYVSQLCLQTLTGPFDYTLHIVNHITSASLLEHAAGKASVTFLQHEVSVKRKTYLHCVCIVFVFFYWCFQCPVKMCIFIIAMGGTTRPQHTHIKTPNIIISAIYTIRISNNV